MKCRDCAEVEHRRCAEQDGWDDVGPGVYRCGDCAMDLAEERDDWVVLNPPPRIPIGNPPAGEA